MENLNLSSIAVEIACTYLSKNASNKDVEIGPMTIAVSKKRGRYPSTIRIHDAQSAKSRDDARVTTRTCERIVKLDFSAITLNLEVRGASGRK